MEYTNKFLKLVLESERFNGKNYYFIWNQFKNILLKKKASCDEETTLLRDVLYQRSYDYYTGLQRDKLKRIPDADRNNNRIIVTAIQFLDEEHAPTRTIIERCKTLKKMGMEVYIVCTSEQYTAKGVFPIYDAVGGAVQKQYYDFKEIQLGEELFHFKQLPANMELEKRFDILYDLVLNYKPYYILSIGTGSMLADMIGNVVPCVSMALAFSTIPKTMNRMKIVGRDLLDTEHASTDDILIESRFTFELKEQKGKFTREELGLPENEFLLAIVGIRLDYEIDEQFLQMLCTVLQKGCHVVFAGIFNTYDALCEKYSVIKDNSTFMGYCKDMPALMEICDLYVNPNRLGGGFSVIEAFDKKVPGVYLKTGDVYAAGGEEFAVNDYEEMTEAILRYKEDKVYYMEMSGLAKKRAYIMTDSICAMQDIDMRIRDIIKSNF